MPKRDPLVTVAIPLYNNQDFIAATISSVLAQTYSNFELLIVDDCSSDRSMEIAEQFNDPRLRLFRHERNLGAEGNWNYCLQHARGKYVKLLCSDDLISPDCLAKQVKVLEDDAEESIAVVCCSRRIVDHRGRELMTRKFAFAEGRHDGASCIKKNVVRGTNFIGEPAGVMFRTAMRERVGLFSANPAYTIDIDYWCRLLRYGDLYGIKAPLATFRLSKQSCSSTIGRRQCRQFWQFIDQQRTTKEPPLSAALVWTGKIRAFVNTILRLAVFRLFA